MLIWPKEQTGMTTLLQLISYHLHCFLVLVKIQAQILSRKTDYVYIIS